MNSISLISVQATGCHDDTGDAPHASDRQAAINLGGSLRPWRRPPLGYVPTTRSCVHLTHALLQVDMCVVSRCLFYRTSASASI